jgi:hypothetical protein
MAKYFRIERIFKSQLRTVVWKVTHRPSDFLLPSFLLVSHLAMLCWPTQEAEEVRIRALSKVPIETALPELSNSLCT